MGKFEPRSYKIVLIKKRVFTYYTWMSMAPGYTILVVTDCYLELHLSHLVKLPSFQISLVILWLDLEEIATESFPAPTD